MASVLEAIGIEKKLQAKEHDRGQIMRAFRTDLRKKRFPALFRHNAGFQDYIKSLKLPRNTQMAPPKDFEGNTYTLQCKFKNLDELDNCRQTIENIINHPESKSVFK